MVLVIDDEATLREIIEEVLALSNIPCCLAANGREGVQLFVEHQSVIDVVLLDMQMPLMNGSETLYELRKLSATVKIVLMSGYPEAATLEKFPGEPHLSYLEKPFTVEKLTLTIEKQLGLLGS